MGESMLDADIVYGKVAIIQRCLQRIRDVTGLEPAALENIDKQDIFILNLQRAIQAALDLAAHVIAAGGFGLPRDLKEHFHILHLQGIMSGDLSIRLEHMAGFRNIVVHEYQAINLDILKNILSDRLQDLEVFYTAILAFYQLDKKDDG